MNKLNRSLSVLLVLIMLLTCSVSFTANAVTEEEWNAAWAANTVDREAAVMMTPGSDGTERYISWYSDSDTGYVVLITPPLGADIRYNASAKATPQGDYRLCAVVDGLDPEKEYQYFCKSGDWQSETYTIAAEGKDSAFTALYVTDIHVNKSKLENDIEGSIRYTAYNFDTTLETAVSKAKSNGKTLDLVISAGDQASYGRRDEYVGVTANGYTKEIPFATSIGNHDRKSVDYRFFTFQPNTADDMFTKSYVGTDYWFVKGDVLFLMMDSNNTSMGDHRNFVAAAVEANPNIKWRVAVFHHDLHGGRIESRESENEFLRLMWAPLADEFGFDLCLLGHSHYYTISNVMYNNKTVSATENGGKVTDAKGTIYMVSGSINNPRTDADGLGENIGHSVLTEEKIYNLIDFSKDSIVINSYTIESDECVGSLTISKTTNEGGHSYSSPMSWLNKVVDVIGAIANIISNIGRYYDNTQLGFDIPLFDGILG